MDDDCRPRFDALGALLAAGADGQTLVQARAIDATTGRGIYGIGWWGVLIPRSAVAEVGVPNADLFWWTEDTEYLQWRIPRSGHHAVICREALVEVERGRQSPTKPGWKYYYEARNEVYHRLWTQRPGGECPVPHHLKIRVRVWRAATRTLQLAARALLIERRHRMAKLCLVARGAYDGVRRRLGRTYPVDDAHRPNLSDTDE
jgi:GT2 family glycosyltransferase